MPTLVIAHNIFLTREERYNLQKGEPLEVVGVNVPVWLHKKVSSDIPQEVFCKYRLYNEGKNKAIVVTSNGYTITIPKEKPKEVENVPPAILEGLGIREGGTCLLDIKDGGSEWMEFKQYNKMIQKDKTFYIAHFVEIKPIEVLMETMAK
jgi:hypothetical protein